MWLEGTRFEGDFTCWCFQDKFLSRHCADQLLQVQCGWLTLLQQEQQPVLHSVWHGEGSQGEDPSGQTPRQHPLVPPSTQRDVTAHPKTVIVGAHRHTALLPTTC